MAQPTTIKSGDPRNDVTPSAPKGYSTFNLSHRFLQTHRFGEITPHCSFETIKGAKDSIRLMNDTSSYSLKAPLKTEMFQKRSNFFVPLQAIIRNNWELLVAQPNSGDDVLPDVDGVVSKDRLNSFFSALVSSLIPNPDGESLVETPIYSFIDNYLHNLLVAEMFFSQGSLCKQLLIDFSHCVHADEKSAFGIKKRSFDAFLEQVLSKLAPVSSSLTGIYFYRVRWFDEDGSTTALYEVVADENLSENPTYVIPGSGVYQQINFRHFLDLARQDLNFHIQYMEYDPSFVAVDGGDEEEEEESKSLRADSSSYISDTLISYLFGNFNFSDSDGVVSYVRLSFDIPLTEDVNFDKLSAYQIVCAHFFSLDHVDYIYSAELYRQLIQYYVDKIVTTLSNQRFTWNGLELHYDALSGYMIDRACFRSTYISDLSTDRSYPSFSFYYAYLTALFSFRHSLRYLDYFTGGRTQPLSVGSNTDPRANVNVAVNNGAVNGVEMILAQNAARYLNFAQRVGKKISQWLDKMFPGGTPKPDMHDPQWLASTGDALNPEQTQNTGEGQLTEANSITARFKNDSNRYMFTIQPDRPGYIICVTYYDVPRAYAYATDRENLHKDRYDRFNPFLQYNGSQAVYKQELGISGDTPFSYQGRYEEYKQKYDIVAGGFVENLPGFAFIADLQSGLPMQQNLNPTYVRSWNTELDPFYLALTGYGLAGYFHFIVKNVNIINCVRPMEYAPQLM